MTNKPLGADSPPETASANWHGQSGEGTDAAQLSLGKDALEAALSLGPRKASAFLRVAYSEDSSSGSPPLDVVRGFAQELLNPTSALWTDESDWRHALKWLQYSPSDIDLATQVYEASIAQFGYERSHIVIHARTLFSAGKNLEALKALSTLQSVADESYVLSRLDSAYETLNLSHFSPGDAEKMIGVIESDRLLVPARVIDRLLRIARMDADRTGALNQLVIDSFRAEYFPKADPAVDLDDVEARLTQVHEQGGFDSPADAGRAIETCLALMKRRQVDQKVALEMALKAATLASADGNARAYMNLARQLSLRGNTEALLNLRDQLIKRSSGRGSTSQDWHQNLRASILQSYFNAGDTDTCCSLIREEQLIADPRVRDLAIRAARQSGDADLVNEVMLAWLRDKSKPPNAEDFRVAVDTLASRHALAWIFDWPFEDGQIPTPVIVAASRSLRGEGDLDGLLDLFARLDGRAISNKARKQLTWDTVEALVRIRSQGHENWGWLRDRFERVTRLLYTPTTRDNQVRIFEEAEWLIRNASSRDHVVMVLQPLQLLLDASNSGGQVRFGPTGINTIGSIAQLAADNGCADEAWRLLRCVLALPESASLVDEATANAVEQCHAPSIACAWLLIAAKKTPRDEFGYVVKPVFQTLFERASTPSNQRLLVDAYCRAVPRGRLSYISEALDSLAMSADGIQPLPSSIEAWMVSIPRADRAARFEEAQERLGSESPFSSGLWATFIIGDLLPDKFNSAPSDADEGRRNAMSAISRGEQRLLTALHALQEARDRNQIGDLDASFSRGEITSIVQHYPVDRIREFGSLHNSFRNALQPGDGPREYMAAYLCAAAEGHLKADNLRGLQVLGEAWKAAGLGDASPRLAAIWIQSLVNSDVSQEDVKKVMEHLLTGENLANAAVISQTARLVSFRAADTAVELTTEIAASIPSPDLCSYFLNQVARYAYRSGDRELGEHAVSLLEGNEYAVEPALNDLRSFGSTALQRTPDIEDVHERQASAAHSATTMSNLLALISHRLGHPNSLLMNASQLLQTALPNVGRPDALSVSNDNLAVALAQLKALKRLLDAERRRPNEIDHFEVLGLISDACDLTFPTQDGWQQGSMTGHPPFEVSCSPELRASCNRTIALLALENLLTNAAKAHTLTNPGTPIAIRATYVATLGLPDEPRHGWVMIEVSDHGPGLPDGLDQDLGTWNLSADPGKGLGVGLQISTKALKEVGGHMYAAATGPTGTTMVVLIPAHELALGRLRP